MVRLFHVQVRPCPGSLCVGVWVCRCAYVFVLSMSWLCYSLLLSATTLLPYCHATIRSLRCYATLLSSHLINHPPTRTVTSA